MRSELLKFGSKFIYNTVGISAFGLVVGGSSLTDAHANEFASAYRHGLLAVDLVHIFPSMVFVAVLCCVSVS